MSVESHEKLPREVRFCPIHGHRPNENEYCAAGYYTGDPCNESLVVFSRAGSDPDTHENENAAWAKAAWALELREQIAVTLFGFYEDGDSKASTCNPIHLDAADEVLAVLGVVGGVVAGKPVEPCEFCGVPPDDGPGDGDYSTQPAGTVVVAGNPEPTDEQVRAALDVYDRTVFEGTQRIRGMRAALKAAGVSGSAGPDEPPPDGDCNACGGSGCSWCDARESIYGTHPPFGLPESNPPDPSAETPEGGEAR